MSTNQIAPEDLLQNLLNALRCRGDVYALLDVGASDRGTIHALLRPKKQRIRDSASNSTTLVDHSPVIAVETVLPGLGNFNWRDYYIGVLRTLTDDIHETMEGE